MFTEFSKLAGERSNEIYFNLYVIICIYVGAFLFVDHRVLWSSNKNTSQNNVILEETLVFLFDSLVFFLVFFISHYNISQKVLTPMMNMKGINMKM